MHLGPAAQHDTRQRWTVAPPLWLTKLCGPSSSSSLSSSSGRLLGMSGMGARPTYGDFRLGPSRSRTTTDVQQSSSEKCAWGCECAPDGKPNRRPDITPFPPPLPAALYPKSQTPESLIRQPWPVMQERQHSRQRVRWEEEKRTAHYLQAGS